MSHQHYPKWIYHQELDAKIVHSKEEHDEHPDWKESPAHFEGKEKEHSKKEETSEEQKKKSKKALKDAEKEG